MAWRAARSLLVLHEQLKTGSRARPPATAADAWGLIGDAAHDPTSDHSPHDFPGWGNQIVTAADFPNAPALGLDAHAVLDDIRRSRDPRAKYGISNGQIFSNHSVDGYAAWTWRPYNPKNGDRHFTHGHLSVVGDARADGTQPWATIGGTADGGEIDMGASEIIKAYAEGQPKASTGEVVSPVAWRIRDEAWQKTVTASLAANEQRDAATLAAVKALTVATGADPQPILNAIAQVGADTHAAIVELQQQLATVQARAVKLGAALAAAGVAFEQADDA